VLVHLASGVGNIVLAAPLISVLHRSGYIVDVRVDGDYAGTADLFAGCDAVRALFDGRNGEPRGRYDVRIPAIPPFYWTRYVSLYRGMREAVRRPDDALFHCDERAYYLEFARRLGCACDQPPEYILPIRADPALGIGCGTLVLAPGCKTGTMAAKRWPRFAELARAFADVVLVGTPDDLVHYDGAPMRFPPHVRSLIGRLSLRATAGALAAAGAVVANDSGLGHLAAAVGAPTVLLFGPTPDATLGRFPPNVRILRSRLPCEPCWFSQPLAACSGRRDCLTRIDVASVVEAVRTLGFGAQTVT
jgi:ADP-heptose:LPS heptosyltransferase